MCISCFLLLGGSKLHDYRTLLFLCSEVSHFVLESKSPNKAFKSDSQRLALSLRSSIAKRSSHLNAALCLLVFQRLKCLRLLFFVPLAIRPSRLSKSALSA
ncbi:hypothetical protein CG015_18410 [Vibrio anguillarum]|nr:hypothetical protein CG015_18410 [Vibrio anguillarum]